MSSLKQKRAELLSKAAQASEAASTATRGGRKKSYSGASLVAGMGLEEAQRKLREYENAETNAPLRYVPVSQIGESRLAKYNRSDAYFKSEEYRARKESIRQHGIEESLLLRQLENNKYELISGHTRLRIARELGLDTVPARVQTYSDAEAALRLVTINEDRTEHSLYDKARLYQGLVETGIFSGLPQVQQRLGLEKTVFYRMLKILDFPPEIGAAFGGIEQINRVFWIRTISDALQANKAAVVARAKELAIANSKLESAEIAQQLCAAAKPAQSASSKPNKNNYADRQWLKIAGRDVGQITRRGKSFQVSINKLALSEEQQEGLIQVMQKYIAGVIENESSE